MGIWWKTVKRELPRGGIFISGVSWAWSKWNPFWRFQNLWVIIEVETSDKYWVFFSDGHTQMRKRKKIKTRYIAVRIGLRDINFSAVNSRAPMRLPESLKMYKRSGFLNWFEVRKKITLGDKKVILSKEITII